MKRHVCLSIILMIFLCSCNSSPDQTSDSSKNKTIMETSSIIETSVPSTDSSDRIEESDIATTLNDVGVIYENVYSKFEELSKDRDFIELSKEEKKEFLVIILDEFIEKGYITEYNFNMEIHPAIVDFKFSCGGLGCYELEDHYDDEN